MHRSKEVLNQLAKLAAEGYLSKKTPLNNTLKKIAKEEALEPHQIEFVAAQANHAVWERLYGMDKKASYDFPIADANEVIKGLQVKPAAGVIKEASHDYMAAPGGFVEKTASFDLPTVDDTPAQRRELRRTLEYRMDKIAHAKEEFQRQMTVLQSRFEVTEKDFLKQARALIMEQPFTDRGQAMDKIAEFVRSATGDSVELGQNLMKKLAAVVAGQGLVKKADLRAPEEYISKNMPAKIVNGRHALYITIQTLKNIRQEYEPLCRGYEIVDSSLPELKEKIRAL